jgi:hypothetical protein
MDSLREVLQKLIERESGRKHVSSIAETAYAMIKPVASVVRRRLQEERLPIDSAADRIEEYKKGLKKADAAIPVIREELEQQLRLRVKRATRPFNDLARYLHTKLDADIRQTDIRDKSKGNKVQVKRTQVLQEWLAAPGGPAELWDEQLKRFQQDVTGWMRGHLSDDTTADPVRIADFSVSDFDLSIYRTKRVGTHDIVQRTAAVLGISAPVAATATWIGTALAAGALFPPAAAVTGVSVLIFMGVQLFKSKFTSLEALQREWIADLDNLAARVGGQFELALGSQCTLMIDRAADALEDYRTTLEDSAERLRERLRHPDFRMRQDLVDQLEPLGREGDEIVAVLNELLAP